MLAERARNRTSGTEADDLMWERRQHSGIGMTVEPDDEDRAA
jgi:hypothetical protein